MGHRLTSIGEALGGWRVLNPPGVATYRGPGAEIAVEETGATAFEKALHVMKGLTTAEAEEKLAKFGYNEVAEYTEPEWKKIAGR